MRREAQTVVIEKDNRNGWRGRRREERKYIRNE